MKRNLTQFAVKAAGTAVLLAILFIGITLQAMAEGSKDLYPSGMTTGRRAYLISRPLATDPAAYFPFPTPGTTRVYAKVGETIYAGFSQQGKSYNGMVAVANITMRAPNGNTYSSPTNSGNTTGLIANRTEELNGPDRGSITAGYTPFYRTVLSGEEGIWEVDFNAMGTGTNFTKGPNYSNDGKWVGEYNPDEAWFQPTSGGDPSTANNHSSALIAAWDVSVGSVSDRAILIPGRVFTTVLALCLPNNFPGAGSAMGGTNGSGTTIISGSGGFYSTFYVLTNDGYAYKVNNHGINGASWSFFANNKGIVSGGTQLPGTNGFTGGEPTYQSQNSIGSTTQNTHDPRFLDATNDFTHKVFLQQTCK